MGEALNELVKFRVLKNRDFRRKRKSYVVVVVEVVEVVVVL